MILISELDNNDRKNTALEPNDQLNEVLLAQDESRIEQIGADMDIIFEETLISLLK